MCSHPLAERRSWTLRIVALLLLAGCGSSIACTAVGCTPGVSLDVSGLSLPASAYPLSAKLCVDKRCEDLEFADRGYRTATSPVPKAPGTISVSLELRDVNGTTLAKTTLPSATVRRFPPTGSKCGPVQLHPNAEGYRVWVEKIAPRDEQGLRVTLPPL